MNSLWAGLEPIPIYFDPSDIDQGGPPLPTGISSVAVLGFLRANGPFHTSLGQRPRSRAESLSLLAALFTR